MPSSLGVDWRLSQWTPEEYCRCRPSVQPSPMHPPHTGWMATVAVAGTPGVVSAVQALHAALQPQQKRTTCSLALPLPELVVQTAEPEVSPPHRAPEHLPRLPFAPSAVMPAAKAAETQALAAISSVAAGAYRRLALAQAAPCWRCLCEPGDSAGAVNVGESPMHAAARRRLA